MNIVVQLLFIMIFVPVSKSDYILYEVTAFNPRERALLYNLQSKVPSIVFLNGVSNEASIPMDVIVNKELFQMFEGKMQFFGIQFTHMSEIKSENLLIYQNQSTVSSDNISDTFYDWDKMLKWIDARKRRHFEKVVIAKTYEKRDVFFLNFYMNSRNPIVLIVGGEEGMDWISSAVILNLLNDLLEHAEELKMLIKNFNFYFLPVLNPDGFVYSKTQDRFWSKNRQKLVTKHKCPMNSEPIGVKIARNWFFHKTQTRAGDVCSSFYIGKKPVSQEETQGLSYVLNSLALNMIAFINVRGFGHYITVPPYADVYTEINNHNIVMEILKATSFKVRRKHNATYYVGSTSNYFYNFTGNMADWVKKKLNTPLVYTIYLEDVFSVLPHPKHIKTISRQFYTILNESLLVTKDIYGSLFNHAVKASISFLLINILFMTLFIYYAI